jgi:hypothetical protein
MTVMSTVFCDVTPCSLVDANPLFLLTYWFHLPRRTVSQVMEKLSGAVTFQERVLVMLMLLHSYFLRGKLRFHGWLYFGSCGILVWRWLVCLHAGRPTHLLFEHHVVSFEGASSPTPRITWIRSCVKRSIVIYCCSKYTGIVELISEHRSGHTLTNFLGFSPRANDTDRATAPCRRS